VTITEGVITNAATAATHFPTQLLLPRHASPSLSLSLSLSPSLPHSLTHTHCFWIDLIDMLSSPSSFLLPPFPGGYYACNKYLKGVAEGTLEGEAKSAHAAEAANLAWQKEGMECHHPSAEDSPSLCAEDSPSVFRFLKDQCLILLNASEPLFSCLFRR
jgi:hypothetical protein